MPGIKNLVRYQQNLAADEAVAFWNMFEAMGGEGSMADMVHAKPSLVNYDYTHINFRGGKHLAGLLYESLIYGKEQYDRRRPTMKRSHKEDLRCTICCAVLVLIAAMVAPCTRCIARQPFVSCRWSGL